MEIIFNCNYNDTIGKYLAAKHLGKRIGKVTTQQMRKTGFLTTYLIEIFKNHKLIKIFQKENYEKIELKKIITI